MFPQIYETEEMEAKKNTRATKSKVQPTNEYGHLQPQARELEEAVLGALMIEKDAYSLVSEILRPESFYEHIHQLIYAAITDLAVRQEPVDILTVTEQLKKRHLGQPGNLNDRISNSYRDSIVIPLRLLPSL